MDTGARVNGLLDRRGYGAKSGLARALGITPARLGHYLNGRNRWPLEFLVPTAEFLGVSPQDLLDVQPSREDGSLPELGVVSGVVRTSAADVVRVPGFVAIPGRFGRYVEDVGTGFSDVPSLLKAGDSVAFQQGTHMPGATAVVAAIMGEPPAVRVAQVHDVRGHEVSLLRGGSVERPFQVVRRDAILGFAVAFVRYRGDEITMCRYEEGGIVPGKLYHWDGLASLEA